MEQTAVEWLAEKYNYVTWLRNRDEISSEQGDLMRTKYLEEAKGMEKQQIEEAAERLAKDSYKKHSVKDDKLSLDEQIQRSGGFIVGFKEGMIEGAKWQQERMYSEEEVYHILSEHTAFLFAGGKSTLTDWFERFKKK